MKSYEVTASLGNRSSNICGDSIAPDPFAFTGAAQNGCVSSVYSEYRTLKDDSEGARYRLEVFTAHEVQALPDNELATIKRQLSYP
jgi:hypothetical protein